MVLHRAVVSLRSLFLRPPPRALKTSQRSEIRDRRLETHDCPVWYHRSSAPTGAAAQKEKKKKKTLIWIENKYSIPLTVNCSAVLFLPFCLVFSRYSRLFIRECVHPSIDPLVHASISQSICPLARALHVLFWSKMSLREISDAA